MREFSCKPVSILLACPDDCWPVSTIANFFSILSQPQAGLLQPLMPAATFTGFFTPPNACFDQCWSVLTTDGQHNHWSLLHFLVAGINQMFACFNHWLPASTNAGLFWQLVASPALMGCSYHWCPMENGQCKHNFFYPNQYKDSIVRQ